MTRERQPISIVRKIAHKAEAVRRCQEDRRPSRRQLAPADQWPRDQVKGDLKLAGAKIKDAIRR
jgi:hypothetical protein